MTPPARKPLVVPKTSRRELAIGIFVGLSVIGALVFGILRLTGSAVDGSLTGTITEKTYHPRPAENQISVGSSGMRQAVDDGDYLFTVHVPASNRDYTVWVDPTVYAARRVGDSFTFPRPAPSSSPR